MESNVTLFHITVPVFRRNLENLRAMLVKAETHLLECHQNEAELMTTQLASDMFPFVQQVQSTVGTATYAVGTLAEVTPLRFPDTETSLLELQLRIDRALEWLERFNVNDLTAAGGRSCILPALGGVRASLPSDRFATEYALPNFFFHLTMSYALLRQFGVPLGKSDYIGPLPRAPV